MRFSQKLLASAPPSWKPRPSAAISPFLSASSASSLAVTPTCNCPSSFLLGLPSLKGTVPFPLLSPHSPVTYISTCILLDEPIALTRHSEVEHRTPAAAGAGVHSYAGVSAGVAWPHRRQQEARTRRHCGFCGVRQTPCNVRRRTRGGGAVQGDITARSNVELRNGVAVRGDPDDRSIRAVFGGAGCGGARQGGEDRTVKEPQTLGPLLPGVSRLESSLETSPHSQKTLTSAAASVWPKGLRTRQVYRAWSLRRGCEMSSWSLSVRM